MFHRPFPYFCLSFNISVHFALGFRITEMRVSHSVPVTISRGPGKEELGLDHCQLLSTTAILHFWMLAYPFLKEEQHRLQSLWERHITIGEVCRESQRRHRRLLLHWLGGHFQSGVQPDSL
jgi:hypothetical protein